MRHHISWFHGTLLFLAVVLIPVGVLQTRAADSGKETVASIELLRNLDKNAALTLEAAPVHADFYIDQKREQATLRIQASYVIRRKTNSSNKDPVTIHIQPLLQDAKGHVIQHPEQHLSWNQVRINQHEYRQATQPWEVTIAPDEEVSIDIDLTLWDIYQDKGWFHFLYNPHPEGWEEVHLPTKILQITFPYQTIEGKTFREEETSYNWDTEGRLAYFATQYESEIPDEGIKVLLLDPVLWQPVATWYPIVLTREEDDEACGQLAKSYKRIYQVTEDPEFAESAWFFYAHALRLDPDDAGWHYGFADLLWQLFRQKGSSEEIKSWQSAINTNPNNFYGLMAMGEIYQSLQTTPNNADARALALTMAQEGLPGIQITEDEKIVWEAWMANVRAPEMPLFRMDFDQMIYDHEKILLRWYLNLLDVP